jgi:hypothetical protein
MPGERMWKISGTSQVLGRRHVEQNIYVDLKLVNQLPLLSNSQVPTNITYMHGRRKEN